MRGSPQSPPAGGSPSEEQAVGWVQVWGSLVQRRSDHGITGSQSAGGGQGDAIVLQKAVSNKEEEPLVPLMDGVGSRTNGCK